MVENHARIDAPRPMHVEEAIAYFQACGEPFTSLGVLLDEIGGSDGLLSQESLIAAGQRIAERYSGLAGRWRDDLKAGGISAMRSMTSNKGMTAIESTVYGITPGDAAIDVQDALNMKLGHLEAMLTLTRGCGGELFRSWSGKIQDGYLSACSSLAGECGRLSELLEGLR